MRLDAAVAAREGITRSQARGLILAGRVRVAGAPATKPGTAVRDAGDVRALTAERDDRRGRRSGLRGRGDRRGRARGGRDREGDRTESLDC